MNETPFKDQSEDKYLMDLLEVGLEKPLGYLPLDTIRDSCGVNPSEVAQYLQQRGFETREWDQSFCKVGSGALYIYDQVSLQKLLNNNSKVLVTSNWPTQADQFVVKVATTHAQSPSPIFDLVADAFADYGNGLRMNGEHNIQVSEENSEEVMSIWGTFYEPF